MKIIFSTLALLLATTAFGLDHSKFADVLDQYQDSTTGNIAYSQLKADIATDADHPLTEYTGLLSSVTTQEFNSWQRNDQMAFLINAYNAFTLQLVADNFPIGSIRDIGGAFSSPWSKSFFSLLGGQITTLDQVEHTWLRPKYQDYRIHAAVNCASVSCPALRYEPFVGSDLDAQLDEQMKIWVTDTTKNLFSGNSTKISKIFDWYGSDFVQWGGGIKSVLKKYADPQFDSAIDQSRIGYQSYNWNLNGN